MIWLYLLCVLMNFHRDITIMEIHYYGYNEIGYKNVKA